MLLASLARTLRRAPLAASAHSRARPHGPVVDMRELARARQAEKLAAATARAPAFSVVRHPQGLETAPRARDDGPAGRAAVAGGGALDAPAAAPAAFAVVELGATQYKVSVDDIINAERLPAHAVGDELRLDRVLLVGTPAHSIVGRPHVPGAVVRARVAEQTRDAKVIIFKKRRRKGYQRKKGFRRYVTVLEILGIEAPEVREAPSDAPEQPAAA